MRNKLIVENALLKYQIAQLIDESIESEDYIIELADGIMDKLIQKYVSIIKHSKENGISYSDINKNYNDYIVPFKITDEYMLGSEYDDMIEYARGLLENFYVIFRPRMGNDKLTTNYSGMTNTIRIVTDEDFIHGVFNTDNEMYYVSDVFNKYRVGLTHELSHVFDDYVSDGKVNSYYEKHTELLDNNEEYFSSNTEVNAYYTETKKQIQAKDYDSWDDYYMDFISTMENYKYLDEKQIKRVISRLYSEWSR